MRVTWFEIPVKNLERTKKFYASILNIQMDDSFEMGDSTMSFFPSESDVSGATGSLIKQESYISSHEDTAVYFSVKEINDVLPRVKFEGCKILIEKMSIGEHGFIAHFEDSEGNRVALHQN